MKRIETKNAVGLTLCHDVTEIVPGAHKGPLFRRGHKITQADVERLLRIGKEHLFIWEEGEDRVHEDDAARLLYDALAGENLRPEGPGEGRINAIAQCDGLLKVRSQALNAVNLLPEMMMSTKRGGTAVKDGDKVAAVRIIPLFTTPEALAQMREAAGEEPIVTVLPFRKKRVGIIVTGNEVYKGRIQDGFTPLLKEKLAVYDVEIGYHALSGDDPEVIRRMILEADEAGCDMILCTGGMSVDPDDKTPAAIRDCGARVVKYGSPVLPGAMFMLAYLGGKPVCGLPGGVIVSKNSMLELVLPHLMADDELTYEDIAALGEGGLL